MTSNCRIFLSSISIYSLSVLVTGSYQPYPPSLSTTVTSFDITSGDLDQPSSFISSAHLFITHMLWKAYPLLFKATKYNVCEYAKDFLH